MRNYGKDREDTRGGQDSRSYKRLARSISPGRRQTKRSNDWDSNRHNYEHRDLPDDTRNKEPPNYRQFEPYYGDSRNSKPNDFHQPLYNNNNNNNNDNYNYNNNNYNSLNDNYNDSHESFNNVNSYGNDSNIYSVNNIRQGDRSNHGETDGVPVEPRISKKKETRLNKTRHHDRFANFDNYYKRIDTNRDPDLGPDGLVFDDYNKPDAQPNEKGRKATIKIENNDDHDNGHIFFNEESDESDTGMSRTLLDQVEMDVATDSYLQEKFHSFVGELGKIKAITDSNLRKPGYQPCGCESILKLLQSDIESVYTKIREEGVLRKQTLKYHAYIKENGDGNDRSGGDRTQNDSYDNTNNNSDGNSHNKSSESNEMAPEFDATSTDAPKQPTKKVQKEPKTIVVGDDANPEIRNLLQQAEAERIAAEKKFLLPSTTPLSKNQKRKRNKQIKRYLRETAAAAAAASGDGDGDGDGNDKEAEGVDVVVVGDRTKEEIGKDDEGGGGEQHSQEQDASSVSNNFNKSDSCNCTCHRHKKDKSVARRGTRQFNELPEGWKSFLHKTTGLYFYYQVETNICTPTHPFILETDTDGTLITEECDIPLHIVPCYSKFYDNQNTDNDHVAKMLRLYYDTFKRLYSSKAPGSNPIVLEEIKFKTKKSNTAISADLVEWRRQGHPTPNLLSRYSGRAFGIPPFYKVFPEIDPTEKMYVCAIYISNRPFGVGLGLNKRAAKSDAAERTLEILLPQVYAVYPPTVDTKLQINIMSPHEPPRFVPTEDLKIYDIMAIDSPLIIKSNYSENVPSPTFVLETFLRRFLPDWRIAHEVVDVGETADHPAGFHYTTQIAEGYETEGFSLTKKDAKLISCQEILVKLFSFLRTWGSLLRYVYHDRLDLLKRMEEPDVDVLSFAQKQNESLPNFTILQRLRQEISYYSDGNQDIQTTNKACYEWFKEKESCLPNFQKSVGHAPYFMEQSHFKYDWVNVDAITYHEEPCEVDKAMEDQQDFELLAQKQSSPSDKNIMKAVKNESLSD